MLGEQNFLYSIDDDWINSILLEKINHPEAYIFSHLLSYVSGNIICATKPVFTEEKLFQEKVDECTKDFKWKKHEVKRAYRIAHEQIVLLAIRRGHIEQ